MTLWPRAPQSLNPALSTCILYVYVFPNSFNVLAIFEHNNLSVICENTQSDDDGDNDDVCTPYVAML